ncbi:MAG: M20/M25/M40 family metallo-hydrolase, partial [Beijerinckiaceae bacterium]|nr:M20/M25/M40 family metallo-hydrolase [Beijerinckiaceae bacterium]
MTVSAALETLQSNRDASLKRLFALLQIKSVSTDPAFRDECQKCADWLAADLNGMGFEASVRPTPGHPMVVAHARSPRSDAPHVLFYGHYDVQPVDPLNLWEADPFAPRIAQLNGEDVVVARGASDDKGQLMTFVEACRAYMANGGLPCHVTILFEGEEECGSSSLPAFLAANRQELKADFALVCDTNMWDPTTPAITAMLRGLVFEEVTIHAANRDLHSGLYGGPAANPIRVLSQVLGKLHDGQGRVTLPGFYDGVSDLPPDIAKQWDALPFDGDTYLGDVGLSVPAGEEGRSVLQQMWARPTCEINGIIGGYTGEGAKTVLPAQASAKVSFRVVAKQDPGKIAASFSTFVKKNITPDCSAEFISHGASPAIQLPFESPALNQSRMALADEWGKDAVIVGSGGSIPIIGELKTGLGIDSLMIGFALEGDKIHSPNEKYNLSSFM